jgi:hypothetical protein
LRWQRPAKSKYQLRETLWSALEIGRNVAKVIGFCQFYSHFIPYFEIHAVPFRTVTQQEYTEVVALHWTPESMEAWEDLKNAIQSDPCIQRFDHHKLIVLRTDLSSLGFGFVLLQPGNLS